MIKRRGGLQLALLLLVVLSRVAIPLAQSAESDKWLQWGGPNRNFKLNPRKLPDHWPESGQLIVWSRPLGEGYSAIVVDTNALYTMYREGESEIVIAIDTATGETLWTYSYPALTTGMNIERGPGPHASPLVVEDRLFAVGATGKFHALKREDGSLIWSHDLLEDFHGTFRNRGYSSSPIGYEGTVIVPVGGDGHALMAFSQDDGRVVWQNGDFDNGQASPILINLSGQDQLVALMATEVAGFNPATGELLWSHPHETSRSGLNISTPVWGKDNVLFVSSAYNGGSRAIKLTHKGAETTPDELWFNNRMRVHFSTVIRLEGYVYGSSGDFGPSFLTCVDIATGEVVWRDRSFAKASFVDVGGKLVLLDEDGNLALISLSPEGLQIYSRTQLLDTLSWTGPTIVGTSAYVRNRHDIMRLELGP